MKSRETALVTLAERVDVSLPRAADRLARVPEFVAKFSATPPPL
jgi:hypothetical protein